LTGLTRLIRSLALMTVIKNLGRRTRSGRRLHPILPDQLDQRLAQGKVLLEERPRVCAVGVHRKLHRTVAVELDPRSLTGESRRRSSRSTRRCWGWGHLGDCHWAVSRPRSRAALETAAPSPRDDGRMSPLDGDCDCAGLPIAERNPASCGTGDRDVDLYMAADMTAPDAPQPGDREIGKLLFPPTSSSLILAYLI
jgi:hypothetical protein